MTLFRFDAIRPAALLAVRFMYMYAFQVGVKLAGSGCWLRAISRDAKQLPKFGRRSLLYPDVPRLHPPPRSISPTPSTVSRFAISDLFFSPPGRQSRSFASLCTTRWKLRRSTRCSSRRSRRTCPSTSLSARRRSQSSLQREIRRILPRGGPELSATEVRVESHDGQDLTTSLTPDTLFPLRWASSRSSSARHGGNLRLGVQRDGTPRNIRAACIG